MAHVSSLATEPRHDLLEQAPAATTPEPVPADDVDDLVEDVSIDGMCGVY
jgi:mycofactocin precursor